MNPSVVARRSKQQVKSGDLLGARDEDGYHRHQLDQVLADQQVRAFLSGDGST